MNDSGLRLSLTALWSSQYTLLSWSLVPSCTLSLSPTIPSPSHSLHAKLFPHPKLNIHHSGMYYSPWFLWNSVFFLSSILPCLYYILPHLDFDFFSSFSLQNIPREYIDGEYASFQPSKYHTTSSISVLYPWATWVPLRLFLPILAVFILADSLYIIIAFTAISINTYSHQEVMLRHVSRSVAQIAEQPSKNCHIVTLMTDSAHLQPRELYEYGTV